MTNESTKIIGVALTLVVGIILVGSLLVPVISDAAEDRSITYTNGTDYFEKSANDHIFQLTSSSVTLDNVVIESHKSVYMYSEHLAIVDFAGPHLITSTGVVEISTEGVIEYSNGVLTVSVGDLDLSYDTSYLWIPSDVPTDYVMCAINEGPYVSSLSDVVTAQYSYDAYTYVENGAIVRTPSTISGTLGGTLNEVAGSEGVYKLVSITQTLVEYPDATAELQDSLIVPAKITVLISGSEYVHLLYVIPVLVLVALLILPISTIHKYN